MHLRVTKYSPQYRNELGHYLRNEWTSIYDIGKAFDDGVLTVEEYLAVEKAYVDTVKLITQQLGVTVLKVNELEIHHECLSPQLRNVIATKVDAIYEGMSVSGRELEDIVRLCLRETIWCKLEGEKDLYIHFGYDYYMYVGYTGDIDLDEVSVEGIHIEEYESPYLDLDEPDE
jgi:hypothetical protein